MLHPLITLTTDFGLSDHYVGTMKGVILGIAPAARIVDITHEIAAFEIAEAGFAIAQAYRYFPVKTIHVIVVDPGVGSSRRAILAEMAGQYFIAPDNGVLSMILAREKSKIRHIANEQYFLSTVSSTFHGRDVFAPCAAYLAAGTPAGKFGPKIEDYVWASYAQPNQTGNGVWTGQVLKVDRFGNLITNFHIDEFPDLRTRPFELGVGLEKLSRFTRTFADSVPGELALIIGSSGYLEAVQNLRSAAKTLGCRSGSAVELKVL